MCGIAGWVGNPDLKITKHMQDTLLHRGPDDHGEWFDERGVWLGHRRLSIIDLSTEGHQPMSSPGGRYIVTYNGEIFNYKDLRVELANKGIKFRGQSDTEVIAAGFEEWGVEATIKKMVGMFALGIYDCQDNCLWLVRDRMGIKPLYYCYRNGEIAVASELQTLKQIPWLDTNLDDDALHAYFRYLCIPAPATVIKGAHKLLPGTILKWSREGIKKSVYWDIFKVAYAGINNPLDCSFMEAADQLDSLLRDSIRMRMVSDVPLGAFLSGGIDSSTVAALMQAQSNSPVKTFTIGFQEKSHDESQFARKVAKYLGTEHHELTLQSGDVIKLIPTIADIYDEPFADGSNVPTYLLSKFTRSLVTVALSGDGGDELFGGYPRYFWASRITRWRKRLTAPGSHLIGWLLTKAPNQFWDGPVSFFGGKQLAGAEGLAQRVKRLGGYLSCPPGQVYELMASAWPDPSILLHNKPTQALGPDLGRVNGLRWSEQMMAVDQANYLADDILTKVDRASMAVSLEARVPLLDHRLVEWSWRVPLNYKLDSYGDRGKLLLREVLCRYIPKDIIERPKMGFGMPMNHWLRTELREWAEDILSAENLKRSGVMDVNVVRGVWREQLQGQNRLSQIWTVLMFQLWYDRWFSTSSRGY